MNEKDTLSVSDHTVSESLTGPIRKRNETKCTPIIKEQVNQPSLADDTILQ